MYPLIGEVNLHSVNVIDFLIFIHFLHLLQDGVYISLRSKVNTVFGDKIRRISST